MFSGSAIPVGNLTRAALRIFVHRVVVWVILANFDGLFAVVAAVGMWATLLQRCPYVHSDLGQ
jgi:hypothetical protein